MVFGFGSLSDGQWPLLKQQRLLGSTGLLGSILSPHVDDTRVQLQESRPSCSESWPDDADTPAVDDTKDEMSGWWSRRCSSAVERGSSMTVLAAPHDRRIMRSTLVRRTRLTSNDASRGVAWRERTHDPRISGGIGPR